MWQSCTISKYRSSSRDQRRGRGEGGRGGGGLFSASAGAVHTADTPGDATVTVARALTIGGRTLAAGPHEGVAMMVWAGVVPQVVARRAMRVSRNTANSCSGRVQGARQEITAKAQQ